MTMKQVLITVIAFSLLLTAVGCDRYIESGDPVRSLPEARPAPVNVEVMLDDQQVTLTWEMPDSSGVNRFRVYAADSTDTDFVLRDSTTDYASNITNLLVNRTYYFTVAAVDNAGFEGLRSTPVSARVGLLSITIELNADHTNSRDVRIQLNSISGTSHVRLSEDSLFADAIFESFASYKNFSLSAGDGSKTVYGEYIFSDGSRTGQPLSDMITLDTRVNIDSVFFSPAGPFTTGDTITLAVTAGEIGGEASAGFPGVSEITLYDDGAEVDVAADDGTYTGIFVVPNDLVVADGQVTGRFVDAAGNSTQATAGRTISIQSTPLPVQLIMVETLSSYELALTWSQAVSSDFASYRIHRDITSSVTEDDELVETITSRSTITYVDNDLDESETYYYRVYVYNSFGLSAGSNTDSATTDANVPPEPVVLAGRLEADSTVGLTWSRNTDADFESYRIYRAIGPLADPPGDHLLIAYINNQTTDSFSDFGPDAATYYYKVYVYDRQGSYAGSNEVIVSK